MISTMKMTILKMSHMKKRSQKMNIFGKKDKSAAYEEEEEDYQLKKFRSFK